MHYSYAEYVELEKQSQIRLEYLDGEIYAMAGGTLDHGVLASAAQAIIRPQLRPGCRTFTSDVRVRVVSTGLSTYPDVGILCGDAQYAPDDHLALINPMVLIEVTSNSSNDYDRGDKLQHYKTIPTLVEVLIVAHREQRVSVHRRDGALWKVIEATQGESVTLESVGATIGLDDLYRDVALQATN